MPDLLPCQKCKQGRGAVSTRYGVDTVWTYIYCNWCSYSTESKNNEIEATAAWNTRDKQDEARDE